MCPEHTTILAFKYLVWYVIVLISSLKVLFVSILIVRHICKQHLSLR
uniref:Uncharacterized protein n=1 Tax=Rhizophora mucronata TaxID=61149 RepID=A0A2P2IQC7_RHIMU